MSEKESDLAILLHLIRNISKLTRDVSNRISNIIKWISNITKWISNTNITKYLICFHFGLPKLTAFLWLFTTMVSDNTKRTHNIGTPPARSS